LKAPLFAVVAEDAESKEMIGCAIVTGDHASFYYIKDVMVRLALHLLLAWFTILRDSFII
jgi:hypothetical protein